MRLVSNEVTVRRCELSDVDDVRRMQEEWAGEEITYGETPSSKEDILQRIGQYFFVAAQGEQIVGFIDGSAHVSEGLAVIPEGEQYVRIDDVYVKPGLRDQGIGGRLLNRLIEAAQDAGIKRFRVYSATRDVDEILKFYRQHGFKSWYVEMFI